MSPTSPAPDGICTPCLDEPNLLRRITKRLLSPSFRQSILSVTDQAVVSGTSFVSSVLIGRACSPDDLGINALAMSILLLAKGIQGDLVSGPFLVYSHRRQNEARSRYAGSSLTHQCAMILITLVVVGVLAAVVSCGGGSPRVVSAVISLMVAVPFVLLREHLRKLSFARLRLANALFLDTVTAVIQLGATGLLAWNGVLTVNAVYLTMAAGSLFACIGWWIMKPDVVLVNMAEAWEDWKSNWQFGRWTLSSQLLSRAMSYLAPWLIAWTDGEAATGIMAASISVVNFAGTFIAGVSNSLTPRAARAYIDGGTTSLRTVLFEASALFLVTIGGFCIFIGLSGEWSVTVIYGDRYAGSAMVLLLLSLQMLANSFGIVAGNGLWAIDRPQVNFRADVLTLVVTCIFMAVSIPAYGVAGAAFGLLAGTIAGALVRSWGLFLLCSSFENALVHEAWEGSAS